MVGANYSKIEDFPHSAYIKSYCGGNHTGVCGSSILNQQILLTAAHCLPASYCTERIRITASIGDENKRTGMRIEASNYKVHEKYLQTELAFDIALVLLETPIALNSKASRVSITKVPVHNDQVACIAGWGFTNVSINIPLGINDYQLRLRISKVEDVQVLIELTYLSLSGSRLGPSSRFQNDFIKASG